MRTHGSMNVLGHRVMTVLGHMAMVVGLMTTLLILPAQAATRLNAAEVVPEFVAMGLKPEVLKQTDQRQLSLYEDEDKYYLEIRFGRIAEDQFNRLKSFFGNLSQVPYEAQREYDLLDFLPPAVQAVANQVFEPIYASSEGKAMRMGEKLGLREEPILFAADKNGVSSFTNCWNTTIEILRSIRNQKNGKPLDYQLYWPGRWETNDTFQEKQYSDLLKPNELRSGDVLVLSQKMPNVDFVMIQHTAFVLTSELVFEKTDTSENDAYRISLRRDTMKKFERVFEKDLIVEYRRFGGPGKKALPPVKLPSKLLSGKEERIFKKLFPQFKTECLVSGCETALGGGCDTTINEIHPTQIVVNPKTGRGILLGDKAVLNRFKPLVPMK